MPRFKKDNCNGTTFEVIPTQEKILRDYKAYKQFIDKLNAEKEILQQLRDKKLAKGKEYTKAQRKEHELGVEYRKIIDEEEKQREVIIKLVGVN